MKNKRLLLVIVIVLVATAVGGVFAYVYRIQSEADSLAPDTINDTQTTESVTEPPATFDDVPPSSTTTTPPSSSTGQTPSSSSSPPVISPGTSTDTSTGTTNASGTPSGTSSTQPTGSTTPSTSTSSSTPPAATRITVANAKELISSTLVLRRKAATEKNKQAQIAVYCRTGRPDTVVTITIASDPIEISTKTDSNGNIAQRIDTPISYGQHQITIAMTDPATNQTIKVTKPFLLLEAEAATTLNLSTDRVNFAQSTLIKYLIPMGILLFFGLVLVISTYKAISAKSESFSTEG